MIANYNMIVDFARPQKSNTIIVAENDVDSRNCIFKLLFDKNPFDMTGVVQATVTGIKADHSYVYAPATIHTDEEGNNINVISWVIPGDITDNAGTTVCTITLDDDLGAHITSFEFYVKVRNALYNEDDFIDDDDKQGLRDLIARCQAALERIEEMVQEEALPCPYPIRITVDNVTYEYVGDEIVEIEMGEVAYLGQESGLVEVTEDDSASAIAVQAASDASDSAEAALGSANDAAAIKEDVEDIYEAIGNTIISLADLQSVVAASSDFADFQARIAAL